MDRTVLVQHHSKLIRDVNAGQQGFNLFYLAIYAAESPNFYHYFLFSQFTSAKHFWSMWITHLQNWVKIQTPMQSFGMNINVCCKNVSRWSALTCVIRKNPPCFKRLSNVVSLMAGTWTPPSSAAVFWGVLGIVWGGWGFYWIYIF